MRFISFNRSVNAAQFWFSLKMSINKKNSLTFPLLRIDLMGQNVCMRDWAPNMLEDDLFSFSCQDYRYIVQPYCDLFRQRPEKL